MKHSLYASDTACFNSRKQGPPQGVRSVNFRWQVSPGPCVRAFSVGVFMNCGIYGIKNIVNGKWYIGQTVNIANRKIRHFSKLKYGKHHNEHLQFSFSKYGKHNFEFFVLEECPKSSLDEKECFWIDYYKTTSRLFGYNLHGGGNLNRYVSEETKQKMSEAWKTRPPCSEETRRKLSQAKKGNHMSDETRRKLSEANKGQVPWIKGKHFSEEILRKMSLAHKGVKWSEKHREGQKHVKPISIETRQKLSLAKINKPWSENRRQAQNKRKLELGREWGKWKMKPRSKEQ
jgi:group I intron endonuclease